MYLVWEDCNQKVWITNQNEIEIWSTLSRNSPETEWLMHADNTNEMTDKCVNGRKATPIASTCQSQAIQLFLLLLMRQWNALLFVFVFAAKISNFGTLFKNAYAKHITAQRFLHLKSVAK